MTPRAGGQRDDPLPKPKKAKDHVDPSTLVMLHAYSGYAYLYLRGKFLDLLENILATILFWRPASASLGAC